jgi:hypothetical protein
MDINKRKLLAAGGLGVLIGGATGAKGAEIHPGWPGFTIGVCKYQGEWCVAVPDWENSRNLQSQIAATKWMPLTEWLEIMDKPDAGL